MKKTVLVIIFVLVVILLVVFFVLNSGKLSREAGESCKVSKECITPMEYLIQSNCPFASLCLENKCRVVCPLVSGCGADKDCDCEWRGERSLECKCVKGECFSIEK